MIALGPDTTEGERDAPRGPPLRGERPRRLDLVRRLRDLGRGSLEPRGGAIAIGF